MNTKPSISGQLLEQEMPSGVLQERCRKELENMLERKLKTVERVVYPIAAVFCLLSTVLYLVVAWNTWGKLPPLATVTFGVCGVFGLLFLAFFVRILRKGRLNLKKDTGFYYGLIWVFMVLMMTVFLVSGQQMEDTAKGTQLILVGLVYLVTFGVVGMLQYNIQQAELRLREGLLKLELQIAALREEGMPKA